jgi:hypothetical protein
MATTSKVLIQVGDEVIELTGADKQAFLEQQEKDRNANLLLEAEAEAKKQARIDAITKLGEASGLTAQEIESILNI